METSLALPFFGGLTVAVLIGSIVRVLIGTRLQLYLVSPDSLVKDQNLIPITADLKKGTILTTLLRGSWRENIDLTLSDFRGTPHSFRIGFGLWKRFFLETDSEGVSLDGRELLGGNRYALRSGMQLALGDRVFSVLVTPSHLKQDLFKDLIAPISDLDA